MNRRSVPRRTLAGLAFILALGLLLVFAAPALADYLGPDRTVSVWQWERLRCDYQAVYDPPGSGWYGCTLELYSSPDTGCPSTSSVAGYFTPSVCGWTEAWCQTHGCDITVSSSTVGCSEGEPGCTAVEHFTTLPEATIGGWVSCGVPGYEGWCLSTAALSLSGSEPLSGYSILVLEGTRNGETFACPGGACAVPLLEGTSDFTYWAISSWGDTSQMGTTSGRVDTQAPVISGDITGVAGDNGWYLSDVSLTASASDPSPGSGLSALEASLDGGAWSAYTGPLLLSDGSHTVDLRAADAAGNVGTQSQAVPVDTQAPTLALSAADEFCPGCGQVLEVTVDVQDTLSGVAEWVLSADGVSIGSGTGPASQTLTWNGSGLAGGVHTLLLEARDTAGNVQDTSQALTLLVPAAPPPSTTPSHPGWTPIVASPTSTSTASQIPTRTSQPTRTASVSGFGGPPVAPVGPGASPAPGSSLDGEGSPPPGVEGLPTGVLWGAAALALIAAATALALDQARRRKEEEERRRAEMQARNAALRAKEEAALAAAIAAANAAAAAAKAKGQKDGGTKAPQLGGELAAAAGAPMAQDWQTEEIAARSARIDQAREAREVRLDWQQEQAEEAARLAEQARLAAAAAAAESLRAAAEREEEGASLPNLSGGLATPSTTPTSPTPTYPYSTPTPAASTPTPTGQSPPTSTATPSATQEPTPTTTPSSTSTWTPLFPSSTPSLGDPILRIGPDFPFDALGDALELGEEVVDEFNLLPAEPDPLYPYDALSPFESFPEVAERAPLIRLVLYIVATVKGLLEKLSGLDPIYPLLDPVPREPPNPEP